jgi:hypothetical protein
MICAVLLLLGTMSYPFNIANFTLLAVLVLVAVIVGRVVYVLYQINVNELVSRITGTVPNRFTPDAGFVAALFTYIVPALVLMSMRLSGSLRYLLDPILLVVK